MKYLLARKKKKIGKYWTYIVDQEGENFIKFSEKKAKEVLQELKETNKAYEYKMVPVKNEM